MIEVKIKEQSLLAELAAWQLKSTSVAIVFGNTIHLWNVNKKTFLQNHSWVRHELKHVRQYQQYGFTKFLLQYLLESINKGYHQNKFEIEARLAEHSGESFSNMIIL